MPASDAGKKIPPEMEKGMDVLDGAPRVIGKEGTEC